MCLAVPGQVVERVENEHGMTMGTVRFGGILKQICLVYVPEVEPGDYVLVHVGFAIGRVDEDEARRMFALLGEIDEASESPR